MEGLWADIYLGVKGWWVMVSRSTVKINRNKFTE